MFQRNTLLLAFALAACGGAAPLKTSTAKPAAITSPTATVLCLDAATFGAVPNTGLDQRIALQSWIDASLATGTAMCCLSPGRYDVGGDPAPGAVHISSLKITGDGVQLCGAGTTQTTIAMIGGKANDWNLLQVMGSHHHVHDLAFDGGNRGATDSEQTHLIQLTGPVSDVMLDHLWMSLPQQPGNHGGDCIRMLGNEPIAGPAELVERIDIDHIWMPECDRSAFGLQRGIRDLHVTNVHTVKVGDQAWDEEPTGQGEIGRVYVGQSELRTGHAGIDVTVTGNNTDAFDQHFEDVAMDGQLFLYRVKDSVFENLRITADGAAPFSAVKEGTGITIRRGVYERTDTTKPGPVLSFSPHATTWPTDVVIDHVTAIQHTDAPVLKFDPGVGVEVDGGIFDCQAPTSNLKPAILATSLNARVNRVHVHGVDVRGNCKWGVQIMGDATTGAGSIDISGNTFEVLTAGVRFDGGAPVLKPVVDGNVTGTAGSATTGLSSVAPASIVYAGTNSP